MARSQDALEQAGVEASVKEKNDIVRHIRSSMYA